MLGCYPAYQVKTRASSQKLHHDPELVPSQEARFVLCDEGAGTGTQHRNLLLDLLDIILAGFEIDLDKTHSVISMASVVAGGGEGRSRDNRGPIGRQGWS